MPNHVHPDEIRSNFSSALSDMYKTEVPLYGDLLDLVADTNRRVLQSDSTLMHAMEESDQLHRLNVERHGAVRLGTAAELETLRRVFAVMGMVPVGYYDLSVAGVPVHATAFRPIEEASLRRNPFRVFTSLLRLELIDNAELRGEAEKILARRDIFTGRCRELLDVADAEGGLNLAQSTEFVQEVLETFRWHSEATVDVQTYRRLRSIHPLIADVVCFKGPHINHLTPRVLDIDDAQAEMKARGIKAKTDIEGPPRNDCPVLLRQTSFLALDEPIRFVGDAAHGTHTARFGEIEQRGCALTPEGRMRYDGLLQSALADTAQGTDRAEAMRKAFEQWPNSLHALFSEGLAFVRFLPGRAHLEQGRKLADGLSAQALVDEGWLQIEALVYEDFLPVSAAGIFRSNLGAEVRAGYEGGGNRAEFERALGTAVRSEFSLYEAAQERSLAEALKACHAVPQTDGA
ncbi:2-oxoadipate dioxygenase/decarboxylase HglS [Ottowia thiooxydans]|uniref:2-oxoadipate dioxygenase/decarboxylase n=1 Tax=Ottowia thiooxydans TaxID=219182 RepID=A0ABV2QCV0_9BURK